MRMWMVNPKLMCRKHLLGEHVECHMIVGSIKKNQKLRGYIENNCLEPESIKKRHDELANEIKRRGYNHKSPLEEPDISYLPDFQRKYKINKDESKRELFNRCELCGG